MRKSKRIRTTITNNHVGKSGGVRTNITAKRLTTPVGFLHCTQTDGNCVKTTQQQSTLGTFVDKSYTGWNSVELQQIKNNNNNNNKNNNCNNKSKSIFREIEKKYLENNHKNQQTIDINFDFSKKLTQQLIYPINNHNNNNNNWKNLNYFKRQISNEIVKIDNKLRCTIDKRLILKKMASTSTSSSSSSSNNNNNNNRKRQICDNNNNNNNNNDNVADNNNNKENVPLKYPCIPSTNWVFQTPPNRKLNFNNFLLKQQQHDFLLNNGDGIMQPAVVHTCNNKTIVYEMNKCINVDLTNFNNKQEIDIDRRYMIEVTNVQHNRQQQQQQQQVFRFNGNNVDQFGIPSPDPYELEHHFLSLTCRPKKSSSTVSRIQNIKRKRDMFSSSSSSSSSSTSTASSTSTSLKQTKFQENFAINSNNDNMEFESSFTVINPNPDSVEESFTFKFTPTGKSGVGFHGGNGNKTVAGRLFDNDGNEKDSFTFQCDME